MNFTTSGANFYQHECIGCKVLNHFICSWGINRRERNNRSTRPGMNGTIQLKFKPKRPPPDLGGSKIADQRHSSGRGITIIEPHERPIMIRLPVSGQENPIEPLAMNPAKINPGCYYFKFRFRFSFSGRYRCVESQLISFYLLLPLIGYTLWTVTDSSGDKKHCLMTQDSTEGKEARENS